MPDESIYYDNASGMCDRLERDARLQPLGDEVMNVTTTEGLGKARELVEFAIHEGSTTAAELSRRTNIKQSQISEFRNDKWKGKPETLLTVASQLARAVNALIVQRRADETRIGGFVKTRVAEVIFSLVAYCIKRHLIGAFVVPAGSGKTMALRQLCEDTPGAILVTVRRTRSSVKSFLQLLARALGMDEFGRAEDIQDAVTNRLVRSDRLVLIDEAHKLPVACLDIVREIADETRVPIVLAGTPSFYTTLTARRVGTVNAELMDQLYSRVGIFRDLTEIVNDETGNPERLFTLEDIHKVFARGKVRLARDGADFLCRIANTPGGGGLRVCRDLVQMVVDLYPDEPVTAARVQGALVMRAGTREGLYRAGLATAAEPREAVAATA
jgi:DNA transposition AAA+ family ATPase